MFTRHKESLQIDFVTRNVMLTLGEWNRIHFNSRRIVTTIIVIFKKRPFRALKFEDSSYDVPNIFTYIHKGFTLHYLDACSRKRFWGYLKVSCHADKWNFARASVSLASNEANFSSLIVESFHSRLLKNLTIRWILAIAECLRYVTTV